MTSRPCSPDTYFVLLAVNTAGFVGPLGAGETPAEARHDALERVGECPGPVVQVDGLLYDEIRAALRLWDATIRAGVLVGENYAEPAFRGICDG